MEDNAAVEEQDAPVPVLQPAPALLGAKRVIKHKILPVITVILLCLILIGELTPDYTVWMGKLRQMDGKDWTGAMFVGIGDITALLLIYSPIDTIFTVVIEGSVGHRLLEPYVAALCSCFVWSLYGLCGAKNINFSVFIVNGIGFIFYGLYTIVMVRKGNAIALGVLRVVAGAVLTMLLTGAFTVGGCYLDAGYGCNKAAIIGWSGALLSFAMYLVPAIQNFINIQEMPLQMVLASVWSAYGVTIGDARMWFNLILCTSHFPNVFGALICMVQLVLYYFSKLRVPRVRRESSRSKKGFCKATETLDH